jgi:hypothetical protein
VRFESWRFPCSLWQAPALAQDSAYRSSRTEFPRIAECKIVGCRDRVPWVEAGFCSYDVLIVAGLGGGDTAGICLVLPNSGGGSPPILLASVDAVFPCANKDETEEKNQHLSRAKPFKELTGCLIKEDRRHNEIECH